MRGLEANGQAIRDLRKARGWTQENLASVAECSVRTVRNAENGARIDSAMLCKLSDTLGVGLSALLHSKLDEQDRCERHKDLTMQWERAYRDLDIERVLAMHHPDSVLEIPGGDSLPGGGVFRGLAELRRHHEITFETFRVADLHDYTLDAVDDYVFYRSTVTVLAVPTGEEFTVSGMNQIQFQDELILHRLAIVDLTTFWKTLEGEQDGCST